MEIVKEIGAYAGLAAVPALAVLAALYFSQARDVKRLREWAGRAPERATEQTGPARVVATPQQQAVAKPAAQKQAAATPAAAPAAAAAAGAAGPATVARPAAATPAAQKAAPVTAQGATAQKDAPAKAPAAPGGVPPRPPGAAPRTVTGRPGQTAIIPPAAPAPQQPWYRRMFPSPRYVALALAGVLIIGGGAAFGLQQFAADEAPTPGDKPAGEDRPAKKDTRAAAIDPASVTVAVLNGTTVPGLAAQVGDKVEASKFDLGTVANSSDQQRAESVVLYAPKAEREATVVGRKLRISQREPIDPQTQGLAGDASVVVIAGADQTR